LWAINNIITTQLKVAEFTQTHPTPFKDGIPRYSLWYWFKHNHPKLTIQLAKGFEVYKAQRFTSESCNSLYKKLQALNDQHK
jgi:hypothetical protein